MGQLLENTEVWVSMQSDLNQMSLVDVASKYEVKAGSIAAAMRRTGTKRQVRVHDGMGLPPEPDEAADASGVASKQHLIEPYKDALGHEADSVIAKKAGVSARTVAAYRKRLQIPGYNRWADPERSRTQKRRSKLDPYRDMVGTVTDAAMAKKAKVSIQAVRNYRVKHGIPSSRSRGGAAAQNARTPSRKSSAGVGEEIAWRITFEGREVRVGFASSLSEVIERAAASGLGDITQVERLAPRL